MMKGFTLIELIIVIAILGVLMSIVVAAINPVDKINSANDAKVQSDISALNTAFEANAAGNNGTYAANIAALVTSGDLKVALTPPPGYCGAAAGVIGNYTVGAGGTSQYASCSTLKSKKYTNANTPLWIWCSSTGKAGAQASNYNCP